MSRYFWNIFWLNVGRFSDRIPGRINSFPSGYFGSNLKLPFGQTSKKPVGKKHSNPNCHFQINKNMKYVGVKSFKKTKKGIK
jgi:hypothetical protein